MSGYTEGPWELEPEETTEKGHYTPPQVFSVADPDNPQIVCTLAVRNGVTELANARLIAAAPELLEALKNARIVLGEAGSDEHVKQLTDTELGRLWITVTKEADAAIAKSEKLGKDGL